MSTLTLLAVTCVGTWRYIKTKEDLEKRAFTLQKMNRFVSGESQRILSTLIPPNVLARLQETHDGSNVDTSCRTSVAPGGLTWPLDANATRNLAISETSGRRGFRASAADTDGLRQSPADSDGSDMAGLASTETDGWVGAGGQNQRLALSDVARSGLLTSIPHCTIMFCRLFFPVYTLQDFEECSRLLSAYDREVNQYGMFKYQHVAQGVHHFYVVCCPRVACPFDKDVQEAPYPDEQYVLEMIRLAARLSDITKNFQLNEHTWLTVRGNADGAGLGLPSYRRRECLDQHVHRMFQGDGLTLHVGIANGPVGCVLLGRCRRFYCIYGNPVNLAARLSQNAVENCVAISARSFFTIAGPLFSSCVSCACLAVADS